MKLFQMINVDRSNAISRGELLEFMNSPQLILDLIEFYESELKIIEKLAFEATENDYNRD